MIKFSFRFILFNYLLFNFTLLLSFIYYCWMMRTLRFFLIKTFRYSILKIANQIIFMSNTLQVFNQCFFTWLYHHFIRSFQFYWYYFCSFWQIYLFNLSQKESTRTALQCFSSFWSLFTFNYHGKSPQNPSFICQFWLYYFMKTEDCGWTNFENTFFRIYFHLLTAEWVFL